jgi:phage/plasmid-like protein (TIGR03299 family)
MSHNVETMAYTNEVPWHGLGTYIEKAPTVKEMIKRAGLTWKVEKRPMTITDTDIGVPDFFALTRTSDDFVLEVVGPRYIPSQIADVFEFFTDFVKEGKATMETAGSLDHGRYVWGLARLNHDFTLPGKDKVKGYLLVACPFKQGKSLLMGTTAVRVVCQNTYNMAMGDIASMFRMNHRNEFNGDMIKKAREVLGLAHDNMTIFEENAKKLLKIKMNKQDTIKILAPVYAPEVELAALLKDFNENATPKIARVMDINMNAPGADPTNAWGVFNAVTYFSDHVASRTPDKRLTNAWMGKTAGHKERVLEALLELA